MSRTAVILTGASDFKRSNLLSGVGFENSARSFIRYCSSKNGFMVSSESGIIDLFDTDKTSSEQIIDISNFLQNSHRDIDSIILYYVGHGIIRPNTNDLYLTVKSTSSRNLYGTSMDFRSLFDSLRGMSAHRRIIGVIDCCFSGSAVSGAMSNSIPGIVKSFYEEPPTPNGSMLICSSGPNDLSYLTEDRQQTKFTSSMLKVLEEGWGVAERDKISGNDLTQLVRTLLANGDSHQWPHVHDIDQRQGSLSLFPFFPIIRRQRPDKKDEETRASSKPVGQGDMLETITDAEKSEIYGLLNAGMRFLPNALTLVQISKLSSITYSYKGRIKKHKSFIEKVQRRRSENINPAYSVRDVTDVVGLRLITLFESELLTAVSELLDIVIGEAKYNPNVFVGSKVLEARIYTTSGTVSPTSMTARLKKQMEDIIGEETVHISTRQDYSSIHIVLNTPYNEDGVTINIPVEIQVRTVFEDTWAQIDHRLRYEKTRQKEERISSNLSPMAEKSLIVLKRYLDTSASFAELIRDELESPAGGRSTSIVSMDSSADFEEASKRLGIDNQLREKILELIAEKDALDVNASSADAEVPSSELVEKIQAFRHGYALIAEKLFRISSTSTGIASVAPSEWQEASLFIHYHARMEEAYCRLRAEREDERLEALRIYRELSVLFPKNPVVHIRLGQAASRNGLYEDAIAAYQVCLENLESTMPSWWEASDIQFQYVRENIHRLAGYANWELFKIRKDSGDISLAAEHLRAAWDISYSGLSISSSDTLRMRLKNNLLCYFYSFSDFASGKPGIVPLGNSSEDWFRKNGRDFISSVELNDAKIQILDTVANVARILDDTLIARNASRAIMDKVSKKGAAELYGSLAVETATASAWMVLKA